MADVAAGCALPLPPGACAADAAPDVPDQAAIVRQYMRHCAQIMSGKNVSKTLLRALQLCAGFVCFLA